MISELAIGSHVPVLAVALYALRPDVLGENAQIRAMAERLTKFYRYTDIVPWDDPQ